jgi:GTP-binding protein
MSKSMKLHIATVGRANVGKSTLFNLFCHKKIAIIDDQPGITRDRKQYTGNIGGLEFIAIDTAGWEDPSYIQQQLKSGNNEDEYLNAVKINNKRMKILMIEQTINAIVKADIVFFVIDGRAGIAVDDLEFANVIRKYNKPTLLLVNKSESKVKVNDPDLRKFGFGEPVYVSATHKLGFDDLYSRVTDLTSKLQPNEENAPQNLQNIKETTRISLSIVGRPNAGKSTLFNRLLGDNRAIVSEFAGTTRDCIDEDIEFLSQDDKKYNFTVIDTAGMRKKAKIQDKVEDYSLGQTITAIKRSNITILLMDAQTAFEKQDMAIAKIAINEGKAIMLVINKFDLVEDKAFFKKAVNECLESYFTDVPNIGLLYISALNDDNVNRLVDHIIKLYEDYTKIFTTGQLNKWLFHALESHSPPLASNGRRIRIKYITQVASRPPTFSLFSNIPENLPKSYIRYLTNSFANYFNLGGVPTRMKLNKGKNPYV